METKEVIVPCFGGVTGVIKDYDLNRDEYELLLKSGARLFVQTKLTEPVKKN